jgi:xylan 1,4-beta-xylosidase
MPGRPVPLILDEFGLDGVWQSGEQRQKTNVGAVWTAAVIKSLVDAGVDGAAEYDARDGIFGAMDSLDRLRPRGVFYTWATRYLVGEEAAATTDRAGLEVMAVRQGDGSASVLVINKTGQAVSVDGLNGWPGGAGVKAQVMSVDASGWRSVTQKKGAAVPVQGMGPYSLRLIRFPAAGKRRKKQV